MEKLSNQGFLDFETRSKRSIEDGAFAYAADESTDILCCAYTIENEDPIGCYTNELHKQKRLFEFIQDGGTIHAHNFLFEIAIMKYVATPRYNWPKPKLNQLRCTMQMAGRAGLPLALADAAKALNITRKLESGKALLKLFSIPDRQGRFVELDSRPREKHDLLEYCMVDTLVSRDIFVNLPEWKDEEIEDIIFDLKSNLNGVPIDVDTSKLIYDEVLRQQESFGIKATKLTNGVITKMTQVQRLKQWVQNNVCKDIPNCAADTIIDILDNKYGNVDSVSEELLLMRQHSGKSSTGKYARYTGSQIDNRIHGMIISFGAHTGRPVSKLLNLYNLPKPSIKYDSMDELVDDLAKGNPNLIDEKYGSYLKAASTAIRGMITAPDNKVLCVSDYAAIEARLVFWLANCFTGLKKYIDGVDLYIDIATEIYSKPHKSITDSERWVGKQVILGAGYGLGAKGFVTSCARWGVKVPIDLAEESINAYREEYPEVVDLWNDIETKALMACRTGNITYAAGGKLAFKTHRTKSGIIMLQMKLPSGRCMNYPDVKIQEVVTPWGAKKKAITYKKVTNGGWFRESTYGGKLTENAVQAIARDCMYLGAKNASIHGYEILFTVYDEIIGMADKNKADIEEFNKLITVKPEWGKNIPLVAEGKILRRYQKL